MKNEPNLFSVSKSFVVDLHGFMLVDCGCNQLIRIKGSIESLALITNQVITLSVCGNRRCLCKDLAVQLAFSFDRHVHIDYPSERDAPFSIRLEDAEISTGVSRMIKIVVDSYPYHLFGFMPPITRVDRFSHSHVVGASGWI